MKNSNENSEGINLESERYILGSCLEKPELIDWYRANGVAEMFYDLRHREFFTAFCQMFSDGILPDLSTVYGFMTKAGYDCDPSYLASLPSQVGHTGNFEFHLKIVKENFEQRVIRQFAAQIENSSAAEFNQKAQRLQAKLAPIAASKTYSRQAQFQSLIDHLENGKKHGMAIFGLQTGFPDIDSIIGGMGSGDYVTIAGRPSLGKTTLALNILENLSVIQGIPTGFISLEMSEQDLNLRSLARFTGIPARTLLLDGDSEQNLPAVFNWMNKLSKAPLHVVRPDNPKIDSIMRLGRMLAAEYRVKALALDYIQLAEGSRPFENKNLEVTEISNGIKHLAVELGIPILVLSQFNRDVEKSNRRPKLSDFRDSGSIEQDTDKAFLLHCPDEMKEENHRLPMNLIIGKNRNGSKGEVNLLFRKNLNRFESI